MKNKKIDTFKMKFVLVIVLTIFISGTVTYGFFNPNRGQTGTNDLATECFNVTFTNESASINLPNAYPIDDSEGQESNPYSFTITNTCSTEASYNILLDVVEGSFDNSYINFSIDKGEVRTLSGIKTNSVYSLDEGYDRSYILKNGTLRKNESASFDIRLWINASMTYDDIANMFWEGQVRVVSTVAALD